METSLLEERRARLVSYRRAYNKAHQKEITKSKIKKRRIRKIEVKNFLGAKCVCCGFADALEFLTVDHVNNDGAEDRRKSCGNNDVAYNEIWRLMKAGLPVTRFALLCWNCNASKHAGNGVCFHKRNK